MENTNYLIKTVTLTAIEPLKVEAKVPNKHVEPVSWEKMHKIMEYYLNECKLRFGAYKFKSMVISFDYIDIAEPNHERSVMMGYDAEGEIYCS
jgi:hypothetical protein